MTSSGTSTGSLELANTSPVAQHCTDGVGCFALVALPRSDVAARLHRTWDARRGETDAALQQIVASDPVTGLAALGRATQLAAQQDDIADLIGAVEGQAAAPASAVATVRSRRTAMLDHIQVCFSSAARDWPAEAAFNLAIRSLGTSGFRHIRTATACPATDVRVSLSANTREIAGPTSLPAGLAGADVALGGVVTIEVSGEVTVSTSDASLRRAVPMSARGVAESAERARREAAVEVAEQVDRAVQQLLLGGREDGR